MGTRGGSLTSTGLEEPLTLCCRRGSVWSDSDFLGCSKPGGEGSITSSIPPGVLEDTPPHTRTPEAHHGLYLRQGLRAEHGSDFK